MFVINNKGLLAYERKLEKLRARAIPFATRNTLNALAFETRKQSIENLRSNFTLRNKWTERSVMVEKASGLNIRTQEAITGSVQDYLRKQEFGATEQSTGTHGVAIPTSYASGEEGARPRQRLPRRPNQIQNILLSRKRNQGKNRKQRNLIAVKQAAAGGNKFVFLDLGKRKGIFKVLWGGKRGRGARLKMVYDLSKPSITLIARPWLSPATDTAVRKMPQFYEAALKAQLSRLSA